MAGGKKEVDPGEELFVVKFVTDDMVFQFTIKKKTVLKNIINAYCNRLGLWKGHMRFLYDGAYVNVKDSPLSLGMEEGDVIEVYRGVCVEYNLSESLINNENYT